MNIVLCEFCRICAKKCPKCNWSSSTNFFRIDAIKTCFHELWIKRDFKNHQIFIQGQPEYQFIQGQVKNFDWV